MRRGCLGRRCVCLATVTLPPRLPRRCRSWFGLGFFCFTFAALFALQLRGGAFSFARLHVAVSLRVGPAGVKLPVFFEHW